MRLSLPLLVACVSAEASWLSAAANVALRAVQSNPDLRLPSPPLQPSSLRLSLLGAQLADLSYATTREEVEREIAWLADGSLELIAFHAQAPYGEEEVWHSEQTDAQWFVARGANRSLFVVFRGTGSLADMIHDLQAMPSRGFHRGFLRLVQRCRSLHTLLKKEMRRT